MRPASILWGVLVTALAASNALAAEPSAADPKIACITANKSAQDLRRTGKLREARAQLVLCVAEACPPVLRDDCGQRLEELDKAMPTLVIEAKDGAGNDLGAVRVTVDGAPLTEKLDGTPLAVDPGQHRLTFEAAGMPKAEKTLIVREGDKGRHERIVLGAGQAVPTQIAPPASTQGSQPASAQSSRGVPTLAIVAGSIGVAGVVIGAATALSAASKHSTLEGECAGSVCPASAQNDLSSFHSLRTISAASYIVGAIGLLGGAGLWFFAPSHPSDASARVWLGPTSAGVMGVF